MTTTARTTGLHPSTRFPVPDETTAPAPAEHRGVPRDGVRLLVARTPDDIRHRVFRDLPDELLPGDLVVVNTSATIAAEADATSTMRGAVVVHVATLLDDGTWVVELRTAPDARRAILDARPGEVVSLDGATLTLLAPYPRRALLPDRRGQPTVARRRRGRPARAPSAARAGPSPTATSTGATRWPTTRRCSASTRAAPRCRRRRVRSPPTWSPG